MAADVLTRWRDGERVLKNGMIQPKGYNTSVTAQASVAIGSRLLDDPFTHLTASANIALWFATDARQETAGWIAVLDEARTRAIASHYAPPGRRGTVHLPRGVPAIWPT